MNTRRPMRSCQLIKDLTQQMALLSAIAAPRVCCSHTTVHASKARTIFLLFLFFFFLTKGNPKPGSPKLGGQKISGEGAEEGNHDSRTPWASCPPIDTTVLQAPVICKTDACQSSPHPSYCGNPSVATTVPMLLFCSTCLVLDRGSLPTARVGSSSPLPPPCIWEEGKPCSAQTGGKEKQERALIDGRLQQMKENGDKVSKKTC